MSKKIVVIMLLTVTVFTAAAQSAAQKPVNSDFSTGKISLL
jgi:hypothetical protein